MKLKHIFSAMVVAGASVSAQAGVYLSEGFDNVAGLSGWAQVSNTVGLGSGWFQGNTGIFDAASGAVNSYAADNFVVSGNATSIDEWLMTPVMTIGGDSVLSFMLRLLGDGYLDTVQVYASNAGSSTNTADFNQLASFSSSVDTNWEAKQLIVGAMTGRLAFRYVVADTSVAGNYVGLDSVTVVPEPASLALVGLALAAGVAARRRRA